MTCLRKELSFVVLLPKRKKFGLNATKIFRRKNLRERKYLERREKVDESKGIPHLHLYINILYTVLQISQQKCAKKITFLLRQCLG